MKVLLQLGAVVRPSVPRSVQRALVRRLGGAGARVGVAPELAMTLRITDDAEIAQLHASFMDRSGPTDVLSFPSEPGDPQSLGDVVIAWPYAVRQSSWRGVGLPAWQAEMLDLAVHGLAHLLGHDHGTRPQARLMLRLERRLARRAQMPPPLRPYSG